ncbi:MAG: hypothetical protein NTY12_04250 [Candidatus Falkowbacteria bacterium]|nr:hypothetical protein [Candidatus Falkowbacteria bacterium]
MKITIEGWSKPREARIFTQANQIFVHFETKTDRCGSDCRQCEERLEKVERALLSKNIRFTKDGNSAVKFLASPDLSKGWVEALKQAFQDCLNLKVLEVD